MVKKKILIIGATGFVGRALTFYAVSNNYIVTGTYFSKKFKPIQKVKYYYLNILDYKKDHPIFFKDFDLIINAAGYVDHSKFEVSGYDIFSSHVSFLLFLLKNFKNSKIVNIGTILEDAADNKNLSFYGFCKKIISNLSIYLDDSKSKSRLISIKFSQIYGPNENKNRIISYIVKNLKKKIFIKNIFSIRNYIYIDDAVKIIFNIGNSNIENKSIKIYLKRFSYSIIDLIKITEDLFSVKIKFKNQKLPLLNLGKLDYKSADLFNTVNLIDIKEGILRSIIEDKKSGYSNSKVSVIINSYNGEHFIKKSVNSVLSQSYKNLEIIFLDNCSTDNTKNIIGKYKDSRIRYFNSQKHLSLANARNLALTKATGEFLAFLDVDDYWMQDKLLYQLALMIKDKSSASVSDYDVVFNNFRISYHYKKDIVSGYNFENLIKNYQIAFSTLMIRKNIIAKYIFNNKYEIISDFEYITRLSRNYFISYLNMRLCKYLLHSSSYSQKNHTTHINELLKWKKDHLKYSPNNQINNKIINLNYYFFLKNKQYLKFFKLVFLDKNIKFKLFYILKNLIKTILI